MKLNSTTPSSRASMYINACFKDVMIACSRTQRRRGPNQGAFCDLEMSGLFPLEIFSNLPILCLRRNLAYGTVLDKDYFLSGCKAKVLVKKKLQRRY